MIVAVTGPGACRPIVVEIVQVLAVQTLGAGLLKSGIALTLPLHGTELTWLPIVGQVPGGAGRVPIGVVLVGVVACVRVIVGRILVPQCGG